MRIINLKKSVVMCNSIKNFLYVCTCGVFATLWACSVSIPANAPRLFVDGDVLTVMGNEDSIYDVTVKVDMVIPFDIQVQNGGKVNVYNLLKMPKQSYNDIAYALSKNDGNIGMSFFINGRKDTSLVVHVEPLAISYHKAKAIEGTCATLSGAFEVDNVESDVIRWAYRKQLGNIGDSTISVMSNYLLSLNYSDYNDYVTKDDVPVISSFRGINYRIESDLVADKYYLFAAKSETEINEFVEEMISLKFEGAVSSLNQKLSCYRAPSTSGIACVFLVGIDNTWKFNIVPVGLVCIDNIKPSTEMIAGIGLFEAEKMLFPKNHIRVSVPKGAPSGSGYAVLQVNAFGGTGVSCKVNFRLTFGGDVKNLTLVREGSLATWLSKKRLSIDLTNVESPYLFSFDLHLEEGDNYVPAIITDKAGNKTEYQLNVPAHFTRTDVPSINIENNIDNNIY